MTLQLFQCAWLGVGFGVGGSVLYLDWADGEDVVLADLVALLAVTAGGPTILLVLIVDRFLPQLQERTVIRGRRESEQLDLDYMDGPE